MSARAFTIREASMEEAWSLMLQVPEFSAPYGLEIYQERLTGKPHLILLAELDGKPAGFKVGYAKDVQEFYSWLGGVLPDYRKQGIAQKLANFQENWAKKQGYTTISFKTRNHHKGMLIFALKNGFDIVGFKERESIDVHRIWLRKQL